MTRLRIHFISGLPRSGSTLLSALLMQNPKVKAGIQSALADVFGSAMRALSAAESAASVSDDQRAAILEAVVRAYYSYLPAESIVYDSNRSWCALLPAVRRLFPEAKVICCVRNPAWILDSFERLVQTNAFRASKLFNCEIGNLGTRAETLMARKLCGPSFNALSQAWVSEYADALIAVRYESLAAQPREVLAKLYEHLGEPPFEHDIENVRFDADGFDEALGMPGLHRVRGPVKLRSRGTILPADVFARYNKEFWSVPGGNPRHVPVL